MSRQNKHAFALTVRSRVVLETVIDDHTLDVLAVPGREMREVCQHPSEIAEQTEERSPTPSLRPVRKRKADIEKPHPAQPGPKPVTENCEDGTDGAGQFVWNCSERLENSENSPV